MGGQQVGTPLWPRPHLLPSDSWRPDTGTVWLLHGSKGRSHISTAASSRVRWWSSSQQQYSTIYSRQEYEPKSLKVMVAALDWYVSEKCSSSILKDKDFEQSRLVLKCKAIELQKSGKGKRLHKADALTEKEEQVLWTTVLGQENPKSLIYTIFFLFGQYFGTRGRQEHHQIQIEDLKQIQGPTGKLLHIEWIEGPTKTRQGGLN